MRLRLLPAVAVYLCAATVAPQAQQTGASVIAGVVLDATTARGVPGAIVRAIGGETTQTRLTDDQGRFYFKFLPAGDFRITASKGGYVDGAFGKMRATGDGIPLTITAREIAPFVRIDLFRPSVIAGYVADESGEPLIGATVHAVRREYVDGVWRVSVGAQDVTDDEGNFRLFDLVPGEYVVVVPSVPTSVPTDMTDTEVDEILTGIAEGTDVARNVVPGATSVPSVIPSPEENAAYFTQYYPGVDRVRLAQSIVLGPGEHRSGLFFQMLSSPTVRVSGTVTSPRGPARNQVLRLLSDDDDGTGLAMPTAIAISGPDGRFTFLRVPAGRYSLEVQGQELPSTPVPVLVPRAEDMQFTWSRTSLVVDTDPVTDIDVVVSDVPRLTGHVIFETASKQSPDARDVRSTIVTLRSANGTRPPLTTNADASGRFSIAGVVPGDYAVSVTAPAGWSPKTITAGGRDVLAADFEASIDRDASPVIVTLTDRPTRVSGVVRNLRRFVAPGSAVIIQPVSRSRTTVPDPRQARMTRASAIGVFLFEGLPPGDYAVTAIDEALVDGWHELRRLEALRAAGTRLTVKDGEHRVVDVLIASVAR